MRAKFGGASSARALGILDRLARIGQQSMRMAQATAQVRIAAGHHLQIPARVSFPEYRRLPEAASQSGRLANSTNERHRMTAMFDERGIRELAPEADALSRVQRKSDVKHRVTRRDVKTSSDFAEQAHRAIQAAKKMANMESSQRSDAQVSNRSRDGLEAERAEFASSGPIASARMASLIRGVIPIRNLSQREFAEPASKARGRDGHSQGITIHSSPTVVINSSTASGGLARDAIGALSAHREELFNQLKRESARRERAQF
ncbi:MAG: hypothetical protein WBQ86_22790 [Candidatus Binatus sp.]